MIQPFYTSSCSDTAIRIRGLSKSYTIQKGGLEKQSTLAESVLSRLRNPFKRAERESFLALRDIDLDIKKGDVVGVIGRNGAGKSTLLKILSRITAPTTGQVELFGRVGSLLEVGTGFHPELTGRENIFLNGAILGMKRAEIKREFDAIVDFAGVEKFLDTPVKRYSSGMYVRLAFAVAAHLRTEILIVDEVLAVGDAEFQKKCLGKMKDVAAVGRTVLYVSHTMPTVSQLCTSCLWLVAGEVRERGDTAEIVSQYILSSDADADIGKIRVEKRHQGTQMFAGLRLRTEALDPTDRQESCIAVPAGGPLVAEVDVEGVLERGLRCSVIFLTPAGARVSIVNSHMHSNVASEPTAKSRFICHVDELMLTPGTYHLQVTLARAGDGIVESIEAVGKVEVEFANVLGTGRLPQMSQGPALLRANWTVL